jgi:hypothetical protein
MARAHRAAAIPRGVEPFDWCAAVSPSSAAVLRLALCFFL